MAASGQRTVSSPVPRAVAAQVRPGVRGVAADHLRLEVGTGEAELVVEPEPEAEPVGLGAHREEDLPPRVGQELRIVGQRAVQRAGRRQVEHHRGAHAAIHQPGQLPAQPLDVQRRARPPPDRDRPVRRIRVGEGRLPCLDTRHRGSSRQAR
jgi:hypothetical protein